MRVKVKRISKNNATHYWVNNYDCCIITKGNIKPTDEGWHEVDEKTYNAAYQRAYEQAICAYFHC